MSTCQIFAYKGNLGINLDMKGKFLNEPTSPGQLGCVVSTTEVEITKEAKELIRHAKRDGGSFAPVMLTEHDKSIQAESGKSSIGILGFGKVHMGTDFTIGRTCTLSILDDCTEAEIEVPADYKAFIDSK